MTNTSINGVSATDVEGGQAAHPDHKSTKMRVWNEAWRAAYPPRPWPNPSLVSLSTIKRTGIANLSPEHKKVWLFNLAVEKLIIDSGRDPDDVMQRARLNCDAYPSCRWNTVTLHKNGTATIHLRSPDGRVDVTYAWSADAGLVRKEQPKTKKRKKFELREQELQAELQVLV